MKLKCLKDYNGYYTEGECYNIVDRSYRRLVIEVNKGFTYNKTMRVEIVCTEEEIEKGIIRNSDVEFMILD
ncbi:hypothetical protein FDC58_15590 [Clostridium botulinum]|nr:hypothetical protein [Clostridium botulinum]NFP30619.1 hypothetical protein [Clostridium botulinum]